MRKIQWAPREQVWRWFAVSAVISAVMLVGTVIAGSLLPGDPGDGSHSLLLGSYSYVREPAWENFMNIFSKNLLVLLLHFFCCLVGAIIGRPHRPLPEKWAKFGNLHSELPKWMADLALVYAFTATLASVAIQTTGLGFILADISSYTDLAPWQLGLEILPHALFELPAIFLPLGLFLIQAKKKELRPLNTYAWQSLLIALPLIIIAALIETFITPHIISHAIQAHGGPDHDYYRYFSPWHR